VIERHPYAKIYREIWDDPDFTALPGPCQALFLKVLSQRNIDLAGLMPLSLNRLARLTAGQTADDVRADLMVLHERQFIVVDFDYDELLVRSLMRNDTLLNKSYKTQLGALRRCLNVSSPVIRTALATELKRCLDMFTVVPEKDIDVQTEALEIIEELGGLGDGDTCIEPPTDTCIEGGSDTCIEPSIGTCSDATAYRKPHTANLIPQTANQPPRPPVFDGTNEGASPPNKAGVELAHKRSPGGPSHSAEASRLATAYNESLATPLEGGLLNEIAAEIDKCREAGIAPEAIAAGIQAWTESDAFSPTLIPKYVHKRANGAPPRWLGKATAHSGDYAAAAQAAKAAAAVNR